MTFSPTATERLFKVLGDDTRLRLLQAIGTGKRSVSEILERTGLGQTLASFHLRILREAGIVMSERRGPFIYYRLTDPSLLNLLDACTKYARVLTDGKRVREFRWPPWAMMCRVMRARRRE
jgi:DNA-binding transcriptional ArsR family regulator